MANADDLIKSYVGQDSKKFTLIAACPVRTIRFLNRWHRGRTRRSFGESGGRNCREHFGEADLEYVIGTEVPGLAARMKP